MSKNSSGLILGLGLLVVAGSGAYFYLKSQGIDLFKLASKNLGGSGGTSVTSGASSVGNNDESISSEKSLAPNPDPVIEPSSIPSSSDSSSESSGGSGSILSTNYGNFTSSAGTNYSIKKGSSGHDVAVVNTSSGKGSVLSQGISLGNSISKNAPTGSIILRKSETRSAPKTSIVSQVKSSVSSGINKARSFVSRIF